MSAPTPPTSTAGAVPSAPWPILTVNERRILGVLVEKSKTTPDAYPLSVNALMTGSNQKSNRDPLLNINDLDVEEALHSLQQKSLVMKIIGGRVERWRHLVYDAWKLDKVDICIVGELLLRGPQTEGELRSRASRMEPIDDIESLRTRLKPLAQRGLVVYLSPEDRRGTMLTHGFHSPKELEKLRGQHSAGASTPEEDEPAPAASTAVMAAPREDRFAALEARMTAALTAAYEEIDKLNAQVTELRQQVGQLSERLPAADMAKQVAELAQELKALKEALGA